MRCVRRVFGKSGEGYYCVRKGKGKGVEVREKKIVEDGGVVGNEGGGIGGYKMFVIVKEMLVEGMGGGEKLYKMMNENGVMVKGEGRGERRKCNDKYGK